MKPPLFLLALLCLTGCVTQGSVNQQSVTDPSALRDLPDHFLVGTHTDASTSEPRAGENCRNPMVDPRDGTRLTLVRSGQGRGDYDVPESRYGIGARQLLRLDCATGRVVGLVRR